MPPDAPAPSTGLIASSFYRLPVLLVGSRRGPCDAPPGLVCEIEDETCAYFLEVLPPKY